MGSLADAGFGSSPLARGLRPASHDHPSCPGIIPARAGFTRWSACRRAGARDHPRSRGVYLTHGLAPTARTGSSPLARGLLGAGCASRGRNRIIPARAGFTGPPHHRSSPSPDHPRSRGVYYDQGTREEIRDGSSPLARGLRQHPPTRHTATGIIPARAGFTPSPASPTSSSRDHPRSRGVYYPLPTEADLEKGSSPLARGLPRRREDAHHRPGIIPARAGFTHTAEITGCTYEDHPRSRGVYVDDGAWREMVRGSSPLARGLRCGTTTRSRRFRIIPARAGFTHRPNVRLGGRRDHPRSRGVYHPMAAGQALTDGSSPLARGLRPGPAHRGLPGRIIPARAGFTAGAGGLRPPHRDHPRSRGVYFCNRIIPRGEQGSSPLARGLPAHLGVRGPGRGIIPARAGFTGGLQCRWRRLRGSSPLARGLRARLPAARGPGRIIPARAGVTYP